MLQGLVLDLNTEQELVYRGEEVKEDLNDYYSLAPVSLAGNNEN